MKDKCVTNTGCNNSKKGKYLLVLVLREF